MFSIKRIHYVSPKTSFKIKKIKQSIPPKKQTTKQTNVHQLKKSRN